MKKNSQKIIVIFTVIIMLLFVCVNNSYAVNTIDNRFLKTSGTKIVDQKGNEVILKGYNIGMWLSRSYWGIPVYSSNKYRVSENNSISMNSEMFNSNYLSKGFTNKDQLINRILGKGEYKGKSTLTKVEIESLLNITEKDYLTTGNYEEDISAYISNLAYGYRKLLLVETLNKVFYDNFITENDVKEIKNTGANVVRIPFDWSFFLKPKISKIDLLVDEENNVSIKNKGYLEYLPSTVENIDINYLNERLTYLEEHVLKMFEKEGIYVVLDMHIGPGNLNTGGIRETAGFFYGDNKHTADYYQGIALTLWKSMAERFKDNPTIAGYDLANEPSGFSTQNNSTNLVQAYYNKAYDTIRNVGDNHLIFMETDFKRSKYWCDNNAWNLTKDPLKTNVVYSTHDYIYPADYACSKSNKDGSFIANYDMNADASLEKSKREEYENINNCAAKVGEENTKCKKEAQLAGQNARVCATENIMKIFPEEYDSYVLKGNDKNNNNIIEPSEAIGRFELKHFTGEKIFANGTAPWDFKSLITCSVNNSKTYNAPIFVGEFNPLNVTNPNYEDKTKADTEETKKVWKYVMNTYLDNKISFASWTYKGCASSYEGMFYYGRNTTSIVANTKENYNNIWIRRYENILETEEYQTIKPYLPTPNELAQNAKGRILLEYATFEEIETVFKGSTADPTKDKKDEKLVISTLNKLYDDKNTVFDDIQTGSGEKKYTLNYMNKNKYLRVAFKETLLDSFGDVTGEYGVNTNDVIRLREYLAGIENSIINEINSDLNADGKIDMNDLIRLREYLVNGE